MSNIRRFVGSAVEMLVFLLKELITTSADDEVDVRKDDVSEFVGAGDFTTGNHGNQRSYKNNSDKSTKISNHIGFFRRLACGYLHCL